MSDLLMEFLEENYLRPFLSDHSDELDREDFYNELKFGRKDRMKELLEYAFDVRTKEEVAKELLEYGAKHG